ncbi:TetR/AcrR family transcriptional regulator [Edaphobacter aggregans]|uniref:TetR/AcrR family transcriptional regulator n=1 Tax=Edaphobacter aggregans TaxID=570835 RepID=UPI00054F6772|nr:TetR/AcrR family transcriptional regulator [Edaphobacter aggregans]
MARRRDPEKRRAILDAAVGEIAESGLSAATAKIAKRAGLAEGTLFTYFANKDELLNELYVELKSEVFTRVNADFPQKASLEQRAWHVWSASLGWAIESPHRRKVSVQLTLSDAVTVETRERVAEVRGALDSMFAELEARETLQGTPKGFGAATMAAMQEATLDFAARYPKQRRGLTERGFALFWRAVR